MKTIANTANRLSTIVVLLIFISPLLISCGKPIPVNYTPRKIVKGHGAVKVEDFSYLAADNREVKPNQIKNIAIGNIFLTEEISHYVTESLKKELSVNGYLIKNLTQLELGGDIVEFTAKDLGGLTVRWLLVIKYVIKKDGKSIYTDFFTSQSLTRKSPEIASSTIGILTNECNVDFLIDAHRKGIL